MSVFRSCFVAIAFLFAAASVVAHAQTGAPILVDKQDPTALSAGGTAAQLLARAAQQGGIRIIAGLNLELSSEDDLSPAAEQSQSARLGAIQDAVIGHALGGGAGSSDVTKFSYVPYVAMLVTSAQLSRALADPRVLNVQEDVLFDPQGYNTKITNDRHVVKRGFDGTGQAVAILDTGIDESSSEFTGRIVAEACFSTNSSKSKSFCPGHVSSSTAAGSGKNCTTSIEACSHGTEVASAAVGSGTVEGFAPNANIIPIQIFSKVTSGGKCSTSAPCARSFQSDQVKGLEQVYALRKTFNIAAANLSVGTGEFNAVCDLKFPSLAAIITKLRHVQIITTTPAGNDGKAGSVQAPGCISTAVAVASSDKTDVVSTSSNFSQQVSAVAPGTAVKVVEPGGTTHAKSGTSISAAEVAGTAAVLFNTSPTATANDVVKSFQCGVVPIADTSLPNVTLQRLDVLASHNYISKPPSAPQKWTFSSASDGKLWTPLLGTWDTKDGSYNLVTSDTTTPWNGSWFPNCGGGVDVSATMTRVDTDPQTGWNSGILIDGIVQKSTLTVSGYYFAYNKQRIPNSTSPAGEATLLRFDSYDFSLNVGTSTFLCPYAAIPVNVGGANTVRIVNNNGTITVYVNGTQFCSVVDTNYASGIVMLVAAYPFPVPSNETETLAIDTVSIKTLPPPTSPADETAPQATAPAFRPADPPNTGLAMSPTGITTH